MACRVKKTWRYSEARHHEKERRRFLKRWYKYASSGKNIIYVDESGFDLHAVRQYGRAPKGQKVHGERPGNRRPRTSLLAARMPEGHLAATQLWEGTCNTLIFNDWLEKRLCPLIDESGVIIMDNATFHKSNETKELIAAKGAVLLFLPPYSPDLNPIEKDFGALKKIREYNHEKSVDEIIRAYN